MDTTTTIDVIRDAVNEIDNTVGMTSMDDTAMVDVAGELRAAARRITDMARMIESEIPDDTPIVGDTWQTKVGRSASRTYNESAILAALSTAYGTRNVGDVIHAAVTDGGAKLSWSWSGLRKLFDTLNIPLTVTPHEVADGDIDDDGTRPHVGEVWSSRVTFEPVTEGTHQ